MLLPLFLVKLLAQAGTTGATVCVQCHPAQARPQPSTSMAHALDRAENCDILRANARLSHRDGPYSYTIVRQEDRSIYTLADGKQTISVPIAWAFGLGSAGQTYVYKRNGNWYESRASFYKKIGGLDLTMGA